MHVCSTPCPVFLPRLTITWYFRAPVSKALNATEIFALRVNQLTVPRCAVHIIALAYRTKILEPSIVGLQNYGLGQ